jgi:HEAT repeat protein
MAARTKRNGWLCVLALALTLGGCARSTDDLLRQLKHTDVVERREAIRALGERGSDAEHIAPALIEALHDESHYVRRDAALALGKLGPGARSAAPALVTARKDRDPNVRRAAEEALKHLDPEAAARAHH